MSERGPIVGATDLSSTGAAAVGLAARMAAATGRPLHVVHVAGPGPELYDEEPKSEAERVYRERLARRFEAAVRGLEAARVFAEGLGPHAEGVLLEGRSWEQLVEYATRSQASLLVVGPHGHEGPRETSGRSLVEWLIGSTADRVLRHAPCPVLVGPRDLDHAGVLHGGVWLVAVDFSDTSAAALEVAHELATPCGAKLVLFHSMGDAHAHDVGASGPFPPLPAASEEALTSTRTELRSWAKARIGVEVEVEVGEGDPATGVVAASASTGATMIVMGTHGRTGVAHLLLGSTAERTLRRSPVPVLTVRGG